MIILFPPSLSFSPIIFNVSFPLSLRPTLLLFSCFPSFFLSSVLWLCHWYNLQSDSAQAIKISSSSVIALLTSCLVSLSTTMTAAENIFMQTHTYTRLCFMYMHTHSEGPWMEGPPPLHPLTHTHFLSNS